MTGLKFDIFVDPLYLMKSSHAYQPIGDLTFFSHCSDNEQIAASILYLVDTQVAVVTDQPC